MIGSETAGFDEVKRVHRIFTSASCIVARLAFYTDQRIPSNMEQINEILCKTKNIASCENICNYY